MTIDKITRSPKYDKTNMYGLNKDYQQLYDELNKLKSIIKASQYTLCNAEHFGWDKKRLKKETKLYSAIRRAYIQLLFTLEDGLSISSSLNVDFLDCDKDE